MCSCDQSLVTLAFLWEKLSQPQFYKDFFEGWSWFKFSNLGLALGTTLKLYTSVTKGLKLKFRKFLGLISTFIEVTVKKLVGGPFAPPSTLHPPSWIGLRQILLTLSQYKRYFISWPTCLFIFLIELLELKRFVLSAKWWNLQYFIAKWRSFM